MAERTSPSGRRVKRLLVPVVAMGTVAGGVLALGESPALATTNVSYACGYQSNIDAFGSGSETLGCGQTTPPGTANSSSPSLSAVGSITDMSGAKAEKLAAGTWFGSPLTPSDTQNNSGRLDVSVAGVNTVLVDAKATTVGAGTTQVYTYTSKHPVFFTHSPGYAGPWAAPASTGWASNGATGFASARCTAASYNTGGVTIKNGFVNTRYANSFPTETVAVPNPTPQNYSVAFTDDTSGDSGNIVFNERIQNADGTLTVTAAHIYLQGPSYTGDIIVAQAKCGRV